MKVRVQMFAQARELFGSDVVEVELPDAANVQVLRERLQTHCPEAAELVERASIAIDDQFAVAVDEVNEAQQISLIPPVSGG